MSLLSAAQVDVVRRNNVTFLGNPAGRTIVFAHGFGCSQATWRRVTPAFLEDYRVVLFDHVGAGDSDLSAYDPGKYDSLHGYADDVVEILRALDLVDVIYVGHSVSSMIGVLASLQAPELFSSLVLVGPSARYVNDAESGYVGGFEQQDIDALLDALDANYLGWSSVMAPVIMGNAERPELGEELESNFCSIDPVIASQFARVTFLSDNRDDLDRVTTPTLILQNLDDAIAPESVGQFVHARIPNSEYVVLDARGHIPNLSEPVALIHAITNFLE